MRQKKRIMPLMLLALFLAWQTHTVLHLVLTPHVVCEHGKVVDVDPHSEQPHHDPENKDDDNHEGCRVLALLTSAKTCPNQDSSSIVVIKSFENSPYVIFGEIVISYGEDLYFLSPSNSPPLKS